MSDKDQIKEEFQNRFSNFEVKVDPKLWNGIQSQLSTAPTPTHSFFNFTSLSIVASISVLSVIGYIAFSDTDVTESPTQLEVTQIDDVVVTDKEEIIEKELVTNKNVKPQIEQPITNSEINNTKTDQEKESKKSVQIAERNNTNNVEVQENLENQKGSSKKVIDSEQREKVVVNTQETISNAPEKIIVSEQSKVVASPMGGYAPLTVGFTSVSSAKQIRWVFDDGNESIELSPSHTYEESGVYLVTMLAELEDGTVVMDKAVVEVGERKAANESIAVETAKIVVPNIFTPNADGENDEMRLSVSEVSSFTISIYSASGKLVFTSDDYNNSWDGRNLRGERVEDGSYYYLINAIGYDGNVYAPKGFVSVRTK